MAGGWWLVAGWLVAGGWWLVAGGWWLDWTWLVVLEGSEQVHDRNPMHLFLQKDCCLCCACVEVICEFRLCFVSHGLSS